MKFERTYLKKSDPEVVTFVDALRGKHWLREFIGHLPEMRTLGDMKKPVSAGIPITRPSAGRGVKFYLGRNHGFPIRAGLSKYDILVYAVGLVCVGVAITLLAVIWSVLKSLGF